MLLMLSGALAMVILAAASLVRAADPPQPDFFWPYGRVRADGANIVPAEQSVLALVNGKVCGQATTLVAAAGPGVPAEDVGKTVYVIDVLADGSNSGQRSGCGHPGDPVTLYFVGARRVALQQPQFVTGGQRNDVDLGPELQFRLQGPMLANDGIN
jgi:hypothetical protein